MTTALELRPLGSVREVPRAAWDAMAPGEASPFVGWTWLDCLEEAGCVGEGTGWTPSHLALYRGGELVAVAPAYVKADSDGEFVFDWDWAEAATLAGIPYYPKLVVAVPFTPATGWRVLVRPGEDRAALTKALASRTARWAEGAGLTGVHVLFPSRDESAWWDEAGYATRLDVQYHWHRREDATWEDFLARFPSKRRRALRHEDDHVAGEGITVETLTADELTPAMAREMYALHAGHVDRFACGRRYLTPRFFELVAERMPERLVWVVARKEGRIVAGAFDVQGGRVLYGRYWGAFERVSFLHFAVCYYHGVRHCLARGLDAFEPGAGGEHKRVRGFDPTLTASNHWIVHPGLRRGVERFLEVERRAVLGWMEEASVARHASG